MTAPDTTAIRAQMEALAGFTAGPWYTHNQPGDWGLGGAHSINVADANPYEWDQCIAHVEYQTPYCLGEKPSVIEAARTAACNARLIAAAPDMRDTILALCDALDELRAENNRLRTIIDNLHAVEEKHRETANAEFHRANRLQVDNERLTKERDEARAQVAATYGSAADALQNVAENWDCGHNESRLCDCARDAEQWSFAADEVRSMTPDDAKAALEAYGREKVREGMQRAAEVARECWNDPPCEADAEYIPNAILADMEKLK